MGREIMTPLEALKAELTPKIIMTEETNNEVNENIEEALGLPPKFPIGHTVWVRHYGKGRTEPKWKKGEIIARRGDVIYDVKLEDGREQTSHETQLKYRRVQPLRGTNRA